MTIQHIGVTKFSSRNLIRGSKAMKGICKQTIQHRKISTNFGREFRRRIYAEESTNFTGRHVLGVFERVRLRNWKIALNNLQ